MVIKSPERKVIDLKHPEMEREEKRIAEREAEELATSAVLLEWLTFEYDHLPKGRRWFIWGGAAAALLILVGLYTRNYFFTIFVALAAFVVYLYAVRPPKEVYCAVTPRGVQIGRRIFEFESLVSFWIFYEVGGMKHLSLHSKKALLPFIRVPLGEMNPVELRTTLMRFVPEEEQEESFAEIIGRLVGF